MDTQINGLNFGIFRKGNLVMKSLKISLMVLMLIFSVFGCKDSKVNKSKGSNNKSASSKNKELARSKGSSLSPKGSDDIYGIHLAGMDTLINPKNGIRRKILTKREGIQCFNNPKSLVPNGYKLDYYESYFVFDVFPSSKNVRFYQIGNTGKKESICGWISASDAANWDTRIGVSPKVFSGGRTPTIFGFETKKDLEEYIKGSDGSDEKAIIKFKLGSDVKPMPWPISQIEQFEHNSRNYELMEVQILAMFTEDTEVDSYDSFDKGSEQPEFKIVLDEKDRASMESIANLDVVFVVDSTKSMQPYIDQVRNTLKLLGKGIKNLPSKPDVAFRLIEYRDYVSNIMWDNSATCDHPSDGGFINLDEFLNEIDKIKEASESSVDWPEAVLDGVHVAINNSDWRGVLSHRIIILVGDSEAHTIGKKNPNKYSINELVHSAKRSSIEIYTLLAGTRKTELQKKQFNTLASETKGMMFNLENYENVIDSIKSILQSGGETIFERQKVIDLTTISYKQSLKNSIELRSTQEAIQKLQQGDAKNKTNIAALMAFANSRGIVQVKIVGVGNPTFCKVWMVPEFAGKQVLEKKVYIANNELNYLINDLRHIMGIIETGEGMVNLEDNLWKDLVDGSVGTRKEGGRFNRHVSVFDLERPGTLTSIYTAVGIPDNGLLRLTKNQLLHLSQDKKTSIRYKIVHQFLPELEKDSRNQTIFTFDGNKIKFGWIFNRHIP